MIKAVIFDMDGLLIDSEPFWRIAQNEVFGALGVHLTPEQNSQTMGMRIDEVVNHWHKIYKWQSPNVEQVEINIIDAVIRQINQSGKLRKGALKIFQELQGHKIPCAIASSSANKIINAVVTKFDLSQFLEFTYSAEDEEYGKPHPGVYLSAAKRLGFHPQQCVAFEDSISGVISAKSSRMHCIAVPDESLIGDERFTLADIRLERLSDFRFDMLDEL